jgi:hypothetical protein
MQIRNCILPVKYIYICLREYTLIIYLNKIIHLVFVLGKWCVLCEVQTEISNTICMAFMVQNVMIFVPDIWNCLLLIRHMQTKRGL